MCVCGGNAGFGGNRGLCVDIVHLVVCMDSVQICGLQSTFSLASTRRRPAMIMLCKHNEAIPPPKH